DGTGANYQPGEGYTANVAVTLYAVWSRTFFLISYNANGHGVAPAAQPKEYGDSVLIAAAPTAPAGCAFVEWNTAADMTGTSYDPADVYTADADLTLYAIWLEGVYTVTFDADGGTVDPLTKTVLAGHKYGTLPVPVKAGETFYGWFIGDLLITENAIVELEGDETLKASWEIRSSMRTKGSDGQLHTGALYVKGSDGVMHMAIAYVKGSDGQMHVNG
ncbi:MAG: InlB B-repeat-containing protein, partial [Oscillospiraceae bacterium]|nr:InlB B-repeat-containing protein [Oscillospiraceae bacterium]